MGQDLDTGLTGRTELRIHGVSGTSPETVLDHPLLKRVKGDSRAGFYRRWYPGGRSADLGPEASHAPPVRAPASSSGDGASVKPQQPTRLEAYGWGHLTSGPAARAAWLMLLPFMLVNLAHWMLPAVPAHAGRVRAAAGRLSAVALRLFGLTLTLTLALTAVQIAMDLVAWQCAGHVRCGTSSPLTAPLTEGFLAEPGRRVVATALVPFGVVGIVAALGRRPLRRTSPEPDVTVATEGDHPMTRPSFWRGNPGMPALRSLHVAAVSALLAAVTAWPATTLAASGSAWTLGVFLCVTSLAVLAWTAGLTATDGVAGRSGERTASVNAARRSALVLLACGALYSVWDHGPWDRSAQLPGVRIAVLVAFGVTLVLLAALGIAVAVQRPWRHRGRDGFQASMRGMGGPAVAVIAFLVAGGFSAGLTYRVADLLGYVVLSPASAEAANADTQRIIADESLPFAVRQVAWSSDVPLVLPPSFAWAGAAATVIVTAVVVIAILAAVGVYRQISPLAEEIAAEHNVQQRSAAPDAPPPPPSVRGPRTPADSVVRRVATVVALARLTDGAGRIVGRVVLIAGLVLLAGLGVYAAGVDSQPLVEDPPFAALTAVGTWLMGAFALGLVGLAWRTARNPTLRRTVGILWDVGSFWPRAAHPLAPPSYGERAVPDLVERVEELAAPGSRVILSGHSQGSVLAAATAMQLPPDVAQRVDVITHGSPLRRLYARHFPAYFDETALREIVGATGTWRNLYRDTDPIGSWVFHPDVPAGSGGHAPEPAVDRRLLDPPTLDATIAGHGEYWRDPRYTAELASLPQTLRPGDAGAHRRDVSPNR